MLRLNRQMSLDLSRFSELYDILIPEDNILRQMNEMIDFSFVYEELKDKYSSTMGRNAEDVIRMFKFIILKAKDKMSDRGLIKRTLTERMHAENLVIVFNEQNYQNKITVGVWRFFAI